MLDACQVPLNLQTIASLLRSPESIGNYRYATAFREWYFEYIAHAVETTNVAVVDTLHASTKNRRASDECDFHSRKIQIQSKLLRAIALGLTVESPSSLSDNAKLRSVLEGHLFRNRLASSVIGELSVMSQAIAWSIHDAVYSAALIRSNFPTVRSGSYQ